MIPFSRWRAFSRRLLVLFCLATGVAQATECVILLHGMGRTHRAMSEIEEKLLEQGFMVWNEGYPSTAADVASLAGEHVAQGISFCKAAGTDRIHFVTHSLGGILVRHYLQDNEVPTLGRIVMLSPPNHGSEVADYLRGYGWYGAVVGPAGLELHTGQDSVPNSLQPIPGEIGIIAGTESLDIWFAWMFNGPNDGKVSVESARLDEMADFLQVRHGHTFIARSDDVIDQISWFLNNGRFNPALIPNPQQHTHRHTGPLRDKK